MAYAWPVIPSRFAKIADWHMTSIVWDMRQFVFRFADQLYPAILNIKWYDIKCFLSALVFLTTFKSSETA